MSDVRKTLALKHRLEFCLRFSRQRAVLAFLLIGEQAHKLSRRR